MAAKRPSIWIAPVLSLLVPLATIPLLDYAAVVSWGSQEFLWLKMPFAFCLIAAIPLLILWPIAILSRSLPLQNYPSRGWERIGTWA